MDSTATEYTSAAGAADETKYPSIMETSTSPEVPDSTFSSQSSSRESPISQQSRGLDEINPLLKDSHPSLLRHNTDLGPEGGSGRRYSVCAVCLGGSGSEYDFEPCYCTNSDSSVPIDSTSSTDHLPEAVHTESRHSQSNEISTTGLGQLLKAVNMASKDPALEHVQSLSWMSFEGDEASRTPSRFLNFLNSASQNPGSEIKRNEVKQRLLDQKNRSGMSMATGLGKSEAEDLPSTQQLPIGRDDEDDSNATEDDDQAQQLEEQSAKKAARTPVKYDEETMDTTPIKSTQARKRKRSLTPDLSPEEPTWYYLHKLPESHIATIDSIFDELLKEFPTFSKRKFPISIPRNLESTQLQSDTTIELAHVRRKVDATFDFVQWTNYDLALTTSTFKNIFKWRNSLWFHCKGEVAINELARLYFDIQNEMNAPPLASDAPSYPNIHNFPDSVLHTLDSILDRFVEEFPQFSNRKFQNIFLGILKPGPTNFWHNRTRVSRRRDRR